MKNKKQTKTLARDEEPETKDPKEEKRRQKIKAVAERVLERNWNEAFQSIMKLKDGASKYSQLSKLAHDVSENINSLFFSFSLFFFLSFSRLFRSIPFLFLAFSSLLMRIHLF